LSGGREGHGADREIVGVAEMDAHRQRYHHDLAYLATAPAGSFPANGYGLFDMAGYVWEWTSDWYRPDYYQTLAASGQIAVNPKGPADSFDPNEPGVRKQVHRGGSFLCTDQYCARYMAGARGKGEMDTGTNHLGFRCVARFRIEAGQTCRSPSRQIGAKTQGTGCLLWAIVDEESIARPREVPRMRSANLRGLASGIHRTRMPQIVVETVLGQMVIDEILRFPSNRASIFQCQVPNLKEGAPFEPIRHNRIVFSWL
jgi:sulfatase-modifying factor enzyme 1